MNNFTEALAELFARGLELFLTGVIIVFFIALIITPLMLTFFADGQVQQVGLVLFIIEVLIGIGIIAEI